MCLVLFAFQHHRDFPLIVAANRDEYYQRPTRPARFWADYPNVFAGQDLLAGGTWMGITRQHRFAAVTNFRSAAAGPAQPLSRGELCRQFLCSATSPEDYLHALAHQQHRYAGFNLLVGTPQQLWYYSNRQGDITAIPAGIHGLSNGRLNEHWPKVDEGKAALAGQLAHSTDPEQLISVLHDRRLPADQQLPDTGIGLDRERLLASRFIQSADYGTRTATVLRIDRHHRADWLEQHFDAKGPSSALVRHRIERQR